MTLHEAMFWALLLKPFAAFAVFTGTYFCARALGRYLPEGRVKRILLMKL